MAQAWTWTGGAYKTKEGDAFTVRPGLVVMTAEHSLYQVVRSSVLARRGGHFEDWHVHTRAIDMPSAMPR